MRIWLGKQRLGQKENHEYTLAGGVKIGVVNYGTKKDPVPWGKEPKPEKTEHKELEVQKSTEK